MASGCYSGIPEGADPDGAGTDGATDGAADQGDGDDDDDDDGADDDDDDDGAPSDGCESPAARLWKLTPSQLDRSLQAALPGAPPADPGIADSLPGGKVFSNETGFLEAGQAHVEALLAQAGRWADYAVANPEAVHDCLSGGLDDEVCVRQGVGALASRAFRRPVSDAELDDLMSLHASTLSEGADLALWQTVRAVLMSPRFLYRSELGPIDTDGNEATVELEGYELASALSYFVTDGPPDATLLAAVEDGSLAGPDALETHARRLLDSEESARGVVQFLYERFGGGRLTGAFKDPELFPEFDDALIESLAAEPRDFLGYVLLQDDARLSTVLTAGYTVADASVAAVYGIDGAELGPSRIELADDRRAGILTQPGLLAALAGPEEGDIVRRGLFMREHLLCETLPPPPPDANAVPPPPVEGQTQRERMAMHSSEPACASCHTLIDPLGFAFGHYDAIGRWRDLDAGQPVDASGTIELDGVETTFADATELANQLVASRRAQTCFVQHTVEYTQGRRATPASACAVEAGMEAFEASDGDIVELVVAMVRHPTFAQRIVAAD